VKVNIEIQCAAESLNQCYRTGLGTPASESCFVNQVNLSAGDFDSLKQAIVPVS
jgi:hypothetical protein